MQGEESECFKLKAEIQTGLSNLEHLTPKVNGEGSPEKADHPTIWTGDFTIHWAEGVGKTPTVVFSTDRSL